MGQTIAMLLGVTLLVAVLHMGLGYVVALLSGLDPLNQTLHGLATLLSFPMQALPEAFHRTAARSYATWFVSSLLTSAVLVATVFAASQRFGLRGGVAATLAFLVAFGSAWAWLANPADDWGETGHRYLHDHYLLLPTPLRESAEERAARFAIHDALNPDRPLRMTRNHWYWNYRPGISGHPRYDAVVVGCEVEECDTLEAFLAALGDQRDPAIRAARWQAVTDTERWTMETALPERAPLPSREEHRVSRIYAKAPVEGVWLGMVARESKLPRERMSAILEAALATVTPMSR